MRHRFNIAGAFALAALAACSTDGILYTQHVPKTSADAKSGSDTSAPTPCIAKTYFLDADKDGFGDPNKSFSSCEQPPGHVTNKDDCNDTAATVKPGASESCNKVDDDCDGKVDNTTSSWWLDYDHDGFGNPEIELVNGCSAPNPKFVNNKLDCDDLDAVKMPGLQEVCDNKDNDCDGKVDEDATNTLAWFVDADGDGHGSTTKPSVKACAKPTGHVASSDDCNDSDPVIYATAKEACDIKDNDCDGETDEGTETKYFEDVDGDGHGNAKKTIDACSAPPNATSTSDDCDDASKTVYPGASESCNEVDDDCDGDTDEGVKLTFFVDADEDAFGDASKPVAGCKLTSKTSTNDTDCNDADPKVHPDGKAIAKEVCDGVDNNCDGKVDDAVNICDDGDKYNIDTCGGKTGCVHEDLKFSFACNQPKEYPSEKGFTCTAATFFTNAKGKLFGISAAGKSYQLTAKSVCEDLKSSPGVTLHVNSAVMFDPNVECLELECLDPAWLWVGGKLVDVKDEAGKKVKGMPGNVTVLPDLDFDFTLADFSICK